MYSCPNCGKLSQASGNITAETIEEAVDIWNKTQEKLVDYKY